MKPLAVLTESEADALLAIEGGIVGDVYELAVELEVSIAEAAALVTALVDKGVFEGFED